MSVNLSAFCFSIVAVFLSYILAKKNKEVNNFALVLSGVIVSSIFVALVSILKYLSEDSQFREITFWMMGGLYCSNWKELPVLFGIVILGAFVIWLFHGN